ncbi:hypothetical protein OBBRIDRAFT_621765 [Obba rivulosa]|uniref:Uncharacterized protein n=1 Tax=Obba rivulosa TaxID=1052685 RepID=A0A8E2DNL0_9APHY|nr:hypothetical protein OBBRIDRAFT_621765 [Obba rivulosa]
MGRHLERQTAVNSSSRTTNAREYTWTETMRHEMRYGPFNSRHWDPETEFYRRIQQLRRTGRSKEEGEERSPFPSRPARSESGPNPPDQSRPPQCYRTPLTPALSQRSHSAFCFRPRSL